LDIISVQNLVLPLFKLVIANFPNSVNLYIKIYLNTSISRSNLNKARAPNMARKGVSHLEN
jgi:hypothetical protein